LGPHGGIAASLVLIAFGIGAIVIGATGRDTVRSDLAREQIVGTPDSTIPGQRVHSERARATRTAVGAAPVAG
jgi:hypothetical protein